MLTAPKAGSPFPTYLPLVLVGLLGVMGCRAPAHRPPPVLTPRVPPRPTVRVKWREIGRSVQGRPLRAAEFGHGYNVTLVFGGYHGDEPVSAELARRFARYMATHGEELSNRMVVVVPEVNPDGLHKGTRKNANAVDLNRNLPATNWRPRNPHDVAYGGPYPASEPETRAVLWVLKKYRPSKVISIHQARQGPMLDYNGPAAPLARAMSRRNGYKEGAFFGALSGSLGSYVGVDKGTPIVTLELRKGVTPEAAWQQNRAALIAAMYY
ncbi:MAG: murein peptide amidase A [Planctomycetes bacterium]|nr:murein peptide amidase A [Planctomycetota bacterium]